jgi:hypothetical protein
MAEYADDSGAPDSLGKTACVGEGATEHYHAALRRFGLFEAPLYRRFIDALSRVEQMTEGVL